MNERIKERREYFGLSQRELARQVGVGKTTISEIEGGDRLPNVSIWYSPVTGQKFPVSRHKTEEIPAGTLKSIRRAAGLE